MSLIGGLIMEMLYNSKSVYLGKDFVYSRDCRSSKKYKERAGKKKEDLFDTVTDLDHIVSVELTRRGIAFIISSFILLIFWRWVSMSIILLVIGFIYMFRYMYSTSNKERMFTSRVTVQNIGSTIEDEVNLVEFSDGSVEYLPKGFTRCGDVLYLCLKGSKLFCIKDKSRAE